MSDKHIRARMRPDKVLVQILDDGTEIPMVVPEIENKEPLDWADDELTPERLANMKRVPRSKTLRRALGLTQEEFAARYKIPIGTLRDWEQGRTEPDAPARAYLHVIAKKPDLISELLVDGAVAKVA